MIFFFHEMARRCFLASFIFTSCFVSGQSPKYVLKGQEVKMNPGIIEYPDEILWKHNGDKVVEFNGNEEQVYSQYENRITLDWHSAQLLITDLRFEDSGDYELEVYMNRNLRQFDYKLEVIDKVAKPTITCEMNSGSSLNMSGVLVCSTELKQPQPLMKFEWTSYGKLQHGPQLTISLGDKLDEEVYSCRVSNPLSHETATFIAKDCYADESSSVALIASLVTVFILLLFLVLGVFICKQSHKACFAKGKRDDVEKQSSSGATEGAHKKTGEDDTKKSHFERAPTLPSTQPLGQVVQERDMDLQDESPQKGHVKNNVNFFETGGQTSPPKLQSGSNKRTAQDDEKRPLLDKGLTFSSPQPLEDPDTVNGLEKNKDEHEKAASPPPSRHNETPSHLDENNLASKDKGDADADQLREPAETDVAQCSNEPEPAGSSTAPEHPESEEENKEAKSYPATANTPTAQPCSPLTPNSPNMAAKDTDGEHKEDVNSDQVNGETATNLTESDASGGGKTNESDHSDEDQQPPTIPEQKGSETTLQEQDSKLTQGETHTGEDNQQETDIPVSADQHEADNVGDGEERDEDQDLYLATSQEPQSPTPTKPDNRNTHTFQGSADTDDPDQEEEAKARNDSDESSESEDKAVDKNEVQCGSK